MPTVAFFATVRLSFYDRVMNFDERLPPHKVLCRGFMAVIEFGEYPCGRSSILYAKRTLNLWTDEAEFL